MTDTQTVMAVLGTNCTHGDEGSMVSSGLNVKSALQYSLHDLCVWAIARTMYVMQDLMLVSRVDMIFAIPAFCMGLSHVSSISECAGMSLCSVHLVKFAYPCKKKQAANPDYSTLGLRSS